MSLGSDVTDLVGGFKPVDCKVLMNKLLEKYIKLFDRIPSNRDNSQYKQGLFTLLKS